MSNDFEEGEGDNNSAKMADHSAKSAGPVASLDSEEDASRKKHLIEVALDGYIQNICSIYDAVPSSMLIVTAAATIAASKLKKFFDENNDCKKETDNNQDEDIGEITYIFTQEKHKELVRLQEEFTKAEKANELLPRGYLLLLVSHYDSFVRELAKCMFYIKPELLNSSERKLTFKELVNLGDLDSAREHLIEKEVDSVLRDSHTDHFVWFEKKLKIELRNDLNTWPQFIEITERRNLFAHCDGIVSKQYMDACKAANCENQDQLSIGATLSVSPDYIINAYKCLFEIGLKLGQVVWRKLDSASIEIADRSFTRETYQLLLRSEYRLVIPLLELYADEFSRNSVEWHRLANRINLAIAYKYSDQKEKMEEALSKEDWTTKSSEFKIAYYVLIENYEQAKNLMIEIGSNSDDMKRDNYCDWPLFKSFRESEEFKDGYHTVFGDEYKVPPISEKLLEPLRME